MKLEDITAEIRPRSEWESIDLGLSLTRHYLSDLWRSWLTLVFPLCLVIILMCYQQPGWAIFAIWWLKPLFERVVLFDLSRRLFGELPTNRDRRSSFWSQVRSLWLLILLGVVLTFSGYLLHREEGGEAGFIVLFWLTVIGLAFYRSMITRSFTLPVRFLENLTDSKYRKRVQLLSRRAAGAASVLTILCLLVEVGLMWSLVAFVELMFPGDSSWSSSNLEDWGQLTGEMLTGMPDVFSRTEHLVVVFLYFCAMTLTAWLYVGGGFGLYVNTRTWTEGWDIELNFKKIGQRLSLILLFLGLGFTEVKAESSQERVAEILAHEDFEIHKSEEERWVPDRKKRSSWSGGNLPLGPLGIFGKVLFWTLLVLCVALLIWLIVRNLHVFGEPSKKVSSEPKKVVKTVAGMDITPESLPEDLVAAARALWVEGRQKDSLGLLYRGAISWLVTQEVASISESDTELDCVRRLKEGEQKTLIAPFEELTSVWMGAAYGRVFPQDDLMEKIFSAWPFRGRSSS